MEVWGLLDHGSYFFQRASRIRRNLLSPLPTTALWSCEPTATAEVYTCVQREPTEEQNQESYGEYVLSPPNPCSWACSSMRSKAPTTKPIKFVSFS